MSQFSDWIAYINWSVDAAAAAAVVAVFMGWAPKVAAVVAFIWYVIQIKESQTIRNWMHGYKVRRAQRIASKMKAKSIRADAVAAAAILRAEEYRKAMNLLQKSTEKAAVTLIEAKAEAAVVEKHEVDCWPLPEEKK